MPRKKHKPEEIVAKLRQVDVLLSQGQTGCRCDPLDRRDAVDVLPVAPGVWWPEVGPGEAPEGSREGERAAAQGGLRPDAGEADPARGCLGKLLLFGVHDASSFSCTSTMSEIILRGSCFSPRSALGCLMMGSEGKGGAI